MFWQIEQLRQSKSQNPLAAKQESGELCAFGALSPCTAGSSSGGQLDGKHPASQISFLGTRSQFPNPAMQMPGKVGGLALCNTFARLFVSKCFVTEDPIKVSSCGGMIAGMLLLALLRPSGSTAAY